MNVNLVLNILFLMMIEIFFGLNFDSAQLVISVVSFCFWVLSGQEETTTSLC